MKFYRFGYFDLRSTKILTNYSRFYSQKFNIELPAGIKYKLNPSAIEILKKKWAKLGQIPDWEYEMDEHPEIMLNKYRKSVPNNEN